LPGVPYWIQS
jgi:hypothetical protein